MEPADYLDIAKANDLKNKKDRIIYRLLEIFPGALTWIALTSPVWLSFTLPFAVAYLIILADTYWLVNAFKISAFCFPNLEMSPISNHKEESFV